MEIKIPELRRSGMAGVRCRTIEPPRSDHMYVSPFGALSAGHPFVVAREPVFSADTRLLALGTPKEKEVHAILGLATFDQLPLAEPPPLEEPESVIVLPRFVQKSGRQSSLLCQLSHTELICQGPVGQAGTPG